MATKQTTVPAKPKQTPNKPMQGIPDANQSRPPQDPTKANH